MKFFNHIKKNKGMTYVELIVVLSIFSLMTSIVLFNYKGFQAKVDIKVLANDIALKIVEAQKSSISGKWKLGASPDWKPSYGVHFDFSDNKKFVYFANDGDTDNNIFDSDDSVLDEIFITKNNFIKDLKCSGASRNILDIVFRRPNSGVLTTSCSGDVEITISSSGSNTPEAYIKVYPSGRIQID